MTADEAAAVRAEVCREVAAQLVEVADLFDVLRISGWSHHFQRDAEQLRSRAANEEPAVEA